MTDKELKQALLEVQKKVIDLELQMKQIIELLIANGIRPVRENVFGRIDIEHK